MPRHGRRPTKSLNVHHEVVDFRTGVERTYNQRTESVQANPFPLFDPGPSGPDRPSPRYAQEYAQGAGLNEAEGLNLSRSHRESPKLGSAKGARRTFMDPAGIRRFRI